MVGFSVLSFFSNDFAFVQGLRVMFISPSSPMTVCELHWQEIQFPESCTLPIQCLAQTPSFLSSGADHRTLHLHQKCSANTV